MRILVVNWLDRKNPRSGGAEIHLHETFGRVASRGHDVTVLCSGWPGMDPVEDLDGMRVHRVGGRHSFLLRAAPYARRHFARAGFDVLVEDLNKVPLFTPAWGVAPVALLVHHLFGEVAFQEASLPFALATWLLERPIGRAYRGLPALAVSGSTRDDLVRRGLRAEDVAVVRNGVDTRALAPDPAVDGFPDPTLLYLGRLQRYKRVDLVLRAAARLRDEGTIVHVRVAGRGDAEAGLRALALELGLGPQVVFEGFVSEERKLELLRRSWIHVLTSPKEGWGISILEAAACGTPSVASDAPGLRDAIRDGETGVLVPHGDTEALARAIGGLVRNPPLRNAMGSAARAWAEALSWDACADGVERFLRERVARPGTPA